LGNKFYIIFRKWNRS